MSIAELSFENETLAAPTDDSQAEMVWRRFKRHKLALIGLAIAISLTLFCFVGPYVSPFDPIAIPTDLRGSKDLPMMSRPADGGGLHIFGTDKMGRDYMTRMMAGGRVSLALAFVVVVITTILGTLIGGVSGYYGGWVDSLIMRIVDFLLTLPSLPIFLAVYTLIPKETVPGGSITVLAIIFILLGWTGPARLVRGMVLSLKNQEFTEAARAVGSSDRRIILRHMIPNAIAPVLVSATLAVGGVVVGEALLSFLGFGVQPPDPSWGNMIQEVQQQMFTDPLKVFFPGMAIFLTSLSFNFIGDALRDALDPRGHIA